MNETQTPTTRTPEPQTPDTQSADTLSIAKQRSLADRILAYSVIGSVFINMGWLFWVGNSNLFGGGGVADLTPKLLKIVKPPIPQKPKPKKKEKPPPPPPKQHIIPPKIRPLKPPPPHPRPQTPRPAPLHRVAVATTHNTRAVSTVTVPETAPNTDQRPTASGDSPQPTPPAPQQEPTPTPAPPPVQEAVKVPPPAPPPVKEVVKTPPPPPPPPPKPKGWVPIDTQEASAPDNVDVSIDGIDSSSITNKEVVISFTIDGTGHVRNARVKTSCGNSELDNRVLEAIRRARCQPAIQDHIPREAPVSFTFPINV